MKTKVSKEDKNKVTLRIEAEEEDLKPIVDKAYRDIASRVKVPGFRKGKAPREVIDRHFGADNVWVEALQNGLGMLYLRGVREAGISPVSDPEVDIVESQRNSRLVFEAKVDVKPEVSVKDYKGVEVEKPSAEVTEEDLQKALDEARQGFATLEVVEGRPVQKGDYVIFDSKVIASEVPEESSMISDRMVEVGAGDFLDEFDEELVGAKKGDILDIVATFPLDYEDEALAAKSATLRTIVKEVKRKVLPPLDDGLAKQVSSFDNLDDFKEDLKSRIGEMKRKAAEDTVREEVIKKVTESTYVDIPESMIKRSVEMEIERLSRDFEERGVSLENYLDSQKGRRHELETALREPIVESLRRELVLEAVAKAEGIEVSDEEARDYVREAARKAGANPDVVLSQLNEEGALYGVKSNLMLSKAVDFLVENAVFEGKAKPEAQEERAEEAKDSEGDKGD
ncbi:MAG: trigger factor [Actinomycetota bacterium]|nr:trigger factor [Actinomycetota bacterium]